MAGISNVSSQAPVEGGIEQKRSLWIQTILNVTRNTLIVTLGLIVLVILFGEVFRSALDSANVDEELTQVLADLFLAALPFTLYLTIGVSARRLRKQNVLQAVTITVISATLAFALVWMVQSLTDTEVSSGLTPSLQFTATQTDEGILVEALEEDGTAALAGLQVGDIITAIRRDPVTLSQLNAQVAQSEGDTPFRLRLLRDGEEMQLTVRSVLVTGENTGFDVGGLITAWGFAVVMGLIGLFGPVAITPYVLLVLSLSPLLIGYAWLIIATFSQRTHGLMPVNVNDEFGGLTLSNWDFLFGEGGQVASIWSYTFNSFVIAVSITVVSLLLCSMAGYALSRMEFTGRRFFLSLTLILHGFPAVTLLIPVYLVLLNVGNIPLIGQYIGYNSLGGIALVMVSFGLPFGVWLMKGFFDNISWDMERSALIDGATRWRTFWEIILPQIRPGLFALGVFSFMGGWNAYLIPAIFSVGTRTANLPVYIRQLTGEVNPVNWNQVAAVGLFQMIPILLLFIFAQEYLLNIYSGGSKGSS